jgi:hypothetical protein
VCIINWHQQASIRWHGSCSCCLRRHCSLAAVQYASCVLATRLSSCCCANTAEIPAPALYTTPAPKPANSLPVCCPQLSSLQASNATLKTTIAQLHLQLGNQQSMIAKSSRTV